MKKVVSFVLSLALVFSVFSFVGTPEASAYPVAGGYAKSTYHAAGGRVNIEYHELYLNVTDGREYAKKSEQTIAEGITWFGASFIPKAGPYLASLGLLRTIEVSLFVSEIRNYTDRNQAVKIVIWKDNFNGTAGRTVGPWNGQVETVQNTDFLNRDYRTSTYLEVKR